MDKTSASPSSKPSTIPNAAHDIPFSEALTVWVKVALNSFGGPAGQIAVMHRLLV